MSEMPVIFDAQQAVRRRPDEHIEVRGHAPDKANGGSRPEMLAARSGLGEKAPEHALGEWIQAAAILGGKSIEVYAI